jgi:hypothetical protein
MYTATIASGLPSDGSILDSTSLDGAVRKMCAAVGADYLAAHSVFWTGDWDVYANGIRLGSIAYS